MNIEAAALVMDGVATQTLEVAGTDLGLSAVAGNFGIGQLVVGQVGQATTVQLVDVINNGNGSPGEALYLYGLGGPDGLRILGGSTLDINSLNVYAYQGGGWVDLNALIDADGGTSALSMSYDGGTIQRTLPESLGAPLVIGEVPNAVPEPSSFALLVVGLLGMLSCRPRRKQ